MTDIAEITRALLGSTNRIYEVVIEMQKQLRELTEERDRLTTLNAGLTGTIKGLQSHVGTMRRELDRAFEERDRLKAELVETTRRLSERSLELTLARAVVLAAYVLRHAYETEGLYRMKDQRDALFAALDRHTKASATESEVMPHAPDGNAVPRVQVASAPPEGSALSMKQEPQPSGAGGFDPVPEMPGAVFYRGRAWCAWCGPDMALDEDGCCANCGAKVSRPGAPREPPKSTIFTTRHDEPSGAIAEGATRKHGEPCCDCAGDLREKLRSAELEDQRMAELLANQHAAHIRTTVERDQAVARVGELEKLIERALRHGDFLHGSQTAHDMRRALGKAGERGG